MKWLNTWSLSQWFHIFIILNFIIIISVSPCRPQQHLCPRKLDLLGQQRRRALKRVPKASQIPAAEKLAETLLQVITVPTCVDNWKNLLTFTYACFSVPGQRGGKRHLSSLASIVNAALACFPATFINVQPLQKKTLFRLPISTTCSQSIKQTWRWWCPRGDLFRG